MKNINERFNIIGEMEHIVKGVKKGSCIDEKTGEMVNLLFFESMTESFLVSELVEKNYNNTKFIDADFVIKNLGFFVVQTIDGQVVKNNHFILITEKRDLTSLEDHIKNNKNINVLEISIEIFQIINYLEHMGVEWRFYSRENLFYDEEKSLVVLQEPINAGIQVLNEINEVSHKAKVMDKELSYLGEILLSFMLRRNLEDDPRNELNKYKQMMRASRGLDDKDEYILLFFIERLINEEYLKKKHIFAEIIDEINNNFNTNYPLRKVDNRENLNFSIFYKARERAKETIEKEIKNLNFGLEKKKVIFLRGEKETGKSTVINQLYRQFNLSGNRTYKIKAENPEDYDNVFISKLRNYNEEPALVQEFGGKDKLIESFEKMLKKDKFNSNWDIQREEAKLLTILVEFILKNFDHDFSIVIVDKFSLISDILQYIFMLLMLNNRKKLAYILVLDDKDLKDNYNLERIRDAFNKKDILTEIKLRNFSEDETECFLKDLLFAKDIPKEFSNIIYEKTYGNLKRIKEIIGILLKNKKLKFDGTIEGIKISPDLEILEKYEFKRQKNFDIEKAFLDLDCEEREFLEFLSALKTYHSEESLGEYFKDKEKIRDKLLKLEELGFIDGLIINGKKKYYIGNPTLKNHIYDNMDQDKRLDIHKIIVNKTKILSKEIKIAIVDHLSMIDDPKTRKINFAYTKEIAESYEYDLNFKRAEFFYERLLDFTSRKEEEYEILLKLLYLRDLLGDKQKFLDAAESLKRLSKDEDNISLKAAFYWISYSSFLISNAEKELFRDALTNLYEANSQGSANIYYFMMKSLEEYRNINFDSSIVFSNAGLRLLEKNDDLRKKVFLYFMKAKAMRGIGKVEEAIKLLYETYTMARLTRDIKDEIYINNEIAEIISEYEGRQEQAYETFKKNLELSEKHNIAHTELISLINLSKTSIGLTNLERAYKYAEKAYIKSEEIGLDGKGTLSLLIDISAFLGEFSKGYKYYLEAREKDAGKYDSWEYFIYIKSISELFFQIRNFERLRNFLDDNMDFIKSLEEKKKRILMTYRLFSDIMLNEKNSEKELLEIIEKNATEEDSYYKELVIHQLYKMGLLIFSFQYQDRYQDFLKSLVQIVPEAYTLREKAARIIINSLRTGSTREEDILVLEEYANLGHRNYLSIAIRIFLTDYYIDLGRDMEAMANAFEGGNSAIAILKKTPYEDRINLYVYNNYAKIFSYILNFTNGIIRKLEKEDYCRGISYEDMDIYIYNTDLYDISSQLRLSGKLIEERIEKNNPKYRLSNSLVNFRDDYLLNLQIFMDFLADRIIATEVYICVSKSGRYIPVALSKKASLVRFNDIQGLMKSNAIRIIRNEDYGMSRMKAFMSMPIYLTERQMELRDEIGIIIFATDQFVNLFNEEGLAIITSYQRMLALLIENYLLEREGAIDGLTGTLSRKYLERELTEGINKSLQKESPFTILMYDLDFFKNINDNYGHQVGDYVLKEVSALVKDQLEGDMKLGRYGGEEFIITLPGFTESQGYEFAEDIRKAIESHEFKEKDDLKITVSIGISSTFEKKDSIHTMINRADQALYKAKSSGRNNSVIWHFAMEEEDSSHLKGLLRAYISNDHTSRLAMVELIAGLDRIKNPEEALSIVASSILEIMQARELVLISMVGEEVSTSYQLNRTDKDLKRTKEIDFELLDEILESSDGMYKIKWNEENKINFDDSVPEWDSILGLKLVEKGERVGAMYMKSNLRDKEYDKDDLKVGLVISTIVQSLL